LLRKFGSVKAIGEATETELAVVVGSKLAKNLKTILK